MRGKHLDIPTDLEIKDFPFQYSHEIPFPIGRNNEDDLVDRGFEEVFSSTAEFFC